MSVGIAFFNRREHCARSVDVGSGNDMWPVERLLFGLIRKAPHGGASHVACPAASTGGQQSVAIVEEANDRNRMCVALERELLGTIFHRVHVNNAADITGGD